MGQVCLHRILRCDNVLPQVAVSSIDVGLLLVCVLGRGHGLDFACLAAAVATEAAAKKNCCDGTFGVVSFLTFYCNCDPVAFLFDCALSSSVTLDAIGALLFAYCS